MKNMLSAAKAAKLEIARLTAEQKNAALEAMAAALLENEAAILAANALDLEAAKGTVSDVMLDRLALSPSRIAGMAQGIRDVVKLPDPVGGVLEEHIRADGLKIQKTAVPMGVIAIIYESRPNVTSDAAALALKSGNVCVLRGGKEAFRSANAIVEALKKGLKAVGITENAVTLGKNAAQLFRISSLDYVNLYPGVLDALAALRAKGCRLWLLSNAQRVFTEYELRYLGLGEQLDGIYISSDYLCRKPDVRFFHALIEEQKLDKANCLMIGNDLHTDIGGARAAGLATLYLHTNLTPPDQPKADPKKCPGIHSGPHWEYEGYDWVKILDLIGKI